jgi:hypothetical protein
MNAEAMEVPAPHAAWQRWLVLVVATAGIVLAIYDVTFIWQAAEGALRVRLYDTIDAATGIAIFLVCWLIAWRGGESVANLAIALALSFAFMNDMLSVAFDWHRLDDTVLSDIVVTVTYIAAAGLFIRASQCFPRQLTKAQVRNRVLATLLRPAVLWPVTIVLGLIAEQMGGTIAAPAGRLGILGLAIAFFYINYRTGDADVRRKVLWFLAVAILAAVFTILAVAAKLVLGNDAPESLRLIVGVGLFSLSSLSIIWCVFAAVFYAGAISPSLVIRKTVVYGLTTALLLFVFATVEVFIHHQLVHFLHVTDTLASSLIGGAFGLTFHPVKHYFEHLLLRFRRRQAHGKHDALSSNR